MERHHQRELIEDARDTECQPEAGSHRASCGSVKAKAWTRPQRRPEPLAAPKDPALADSATAQTLPDKTLTRSPQDADSHLGSWDLDSLPPDSLMRYDC